MIFMSSLILSMFITIALIPIFKGVAVRMNTAIDLPNERKVHQCPMPKIGGIAMAMGALVSILVWKQSVDQFALAVLAGSAVIVFFGLIDDIKGMGYKSKFLAQLVATLIVVFYGQVKIVSLGWLLPQELILPDYLAIPLTVIVIVGVTNAINLADGLDGLAGGISLLSFLCIAYLAYQTDHLVVSLFAVVMVGAIFGFLRFNTFPATVFMGDTGSQLIGFLAIVLSLALTQGSSPLSPLLPLVLLGFPILDTLMVMLERLAKGRSPFVADKNHLHHKLIKMGLFHTEAVFVIYLLQAFLVTSAFVFRFYSEWFLLLFYLIFSALLVGGLLIADKSGWQIPRHVFFDRLVKGKLKTLKEKNIIIKISYRIIEFGLPALLLVTCLLPAAIPPYLSSFSLAFVWLILMVWLLRKEWLDKVAQVSLYLLVPFIIYYGDANPMPWVSAAWLQIYNLSFGVLVVALILTLKFTRRQKGFKSTPMDFLILFIALVVPNLPDEQIQSYNMGLVAAKILVFFLVYEVLAGEFRGDVGKLGISTLTVLLIVVLRGFF